MRGFVVLLSVCLPAGLGSAQVQQNSGTDVQLRGISAVSDKVAWASGAKGTVLRTVDGGATWQHVEVVGASALDFRDVQAFDANTAFVLSIGPGEQSRIYKTSDGGKIWQLQFTNKDPRAFYDCFAFWDSTHGIALSDSVDGKFPLISTSDGATWNPVDIKKMPAALPNEGAFAASGTCIATFGKNDVWFGTGGPAARVFHSADRGQTWTAAETPVMHGAATQGVFSLAFWTAKDGVAVGGDYKEPAKGEHTAAFTKDGGKTWTLAPHPPSGYRSGVAIAGISGSHVLVAVGTNGADQTNNGGESWHSLHNRDFNAVNFAGPQAGWAVGPLGQIMRYPSFLPKELSSH
ncbi:MAG TPA: hypothetical protein VH724_14675 [Candidatus Angelobacter sp.]|nr:hypothetical protein [Candidatus Angelobacter sp.]